MFTDETLVRFREDRKLKGVGASVPKFDLHLVTVYSQDLRVDLPSLLIGKHPGWRQAGNGKKRMSKEKVVFMSRAFRISIRCNKSDFALFCKWNSGNLSL